MVMILLKFQVFSAMCKTIVFFSGMPNIGVTIAITLHPVIAVQLIITLKSIMITIMHSHC